jgi:hypothetical protein
MREREQLLKRAGGNFDRSLQLMRSQDPQLKKDSFNLLGPLACAHIVELMAEFRHPDSNDRYWILELIADSGSEQAFDLLVEALDHEREETGRVPHMRCKPPKRVAACYSSVVSCNTDGSS